MLNVSHLSRRSHHEGATSLLACIALAATAAKAQPQTAFPAAQTRQAELSAWKRYTVEGERFSVTLPTVPAMTTSRKLIWDIRRTQRQRNIGAYGDGAVYAVYVYENVGNQSLAEFIRERNRYSRWDGSSETGFTVGEIKGEQLTLVVSNGPDVPTNIGVETILPARDVDVRARILTKPIPSFAESAREKRISGTVMLKVVLTSRGTVDNIQVVQAVPGLTEQAIEAARKIKFMPAMKLGKYVSTTLQLEYSLSYS